VVNKSRNKGSISNNFTGSYSDQKLTKSYLLLKIHLVGNEMVDWGGRMGWEELTIGYWKEIIYIRLKTKIWAKKAPEGSIKLLRKDPAKHLTGSINIS
jgi:hypothetical protein